MSNQSVETDHPYHSKTIAEIVHDYAVVRGDLSEQYARDQLVRVIEERMAQAWDEGHRFTGYEPGRGENPYAPNWAAIAHPAQARLDAVLQKLDNQNPREAQPMTDHAQNQSPADAARAALVELLNDDEPAVCIQAAELLLRYS